MTTITWTAIFRNLVVPSPRFAAWDFKLANSRVGTGAASWVRVGFTKGSWVTNWGIVAGFASSALGFSRAGATAAARPIGLAAIGSGFLLLSGCADGRLGSPGSAGRESKSARSAGSGAGVGSASGSSRGKGAEGGTGDACATMLGTDGAGRGRVGAGGVNGVAEICGARTLAGCEIPGAGCPGREGGTLPSFFRNSPRATRSVLFDCSILIGLVKTRLAPMRNALATPVCPSTTATDSEL